MNKKPTVLLILDGWGCREETAHNPTKTVPTPTIDRLFNESPNIRLKASGKAVGLPDGQMGNSEVGHLHLGAGRKIPQDLVRINTDIQNNRFCSNATIAQAISQAKNTNKSIHIIGLLSPGGVHSHEDHIAELIRCCQQANVTSYLHAILDGRDTPPQSASASLKKIDQRYQEKNNGRIASIIGRYYAMDRNKNWDRTQQAYNLLVHAQAARNASDSATALSLAYKANETDEFVKPTTVGAPLSIQSGDIIIFMNFRADRAKQLTAAFTEENFPHFDTKTSLKLGSYVMLTEYFKNPNLSVAYPPLSFPNTLGEFLSKNNLKQLRLAETEKYAHVTYFFNGGIETPYPNEERVLIPSPKVTTYDLQPEMSAVAVTDTLCDAILSMNYDVIICNYANPDMIGHTGVESAARTTMSVMDTCLYRVIDALKTVNGQAFITADHGNIEQMFDETTGQPHTAHTTNDVPLIYYGEPAVFQTDSGSLDDVAPTLLTAMGLTPPKEMTGKALLKKQALK